MMTLTARTFIAATLLVEFSAANSKYENFERHAIDIPHENHAVGIPHHVVDIPRENLAIDIRHENHIMGIPRESHAVDIRNNNSDVFPSQKNVKPFLSVKPFLDSKVQNLESPKSITHYFDDRRRKSPSSTSPERRKSPRSSTESSPKNKFRRFAKQHPKKVPSPFVQRLQSRRESSRISGESEIKIKIRISEDPKESTKTRIESIPNTGDDTNRDPGPTGADEKATGADNHNEPAENESETPPPVKLSKERLDRLLAELEKRTPETEHRLATMHHRQQRNAPALAKQEEEVRKPEEEIEEEGERRMGKSLRHIGDRILSTLETVFDWIPDWMVDKFMIEETNFSPPTKMNTRQNPAMILRGLPSMIIDDHSSDGASPVHEGGSSRSNSSEGPSSEISGDKQRQSWPIQSEISEWGRESGEWERESDSGVFAALLRFATSWIPR